MNEPRTTGQSWRNLKQWHKNKRARNRRASAALLHGFGIAFDCNNNGGHLIVRHAGRVIDFFPTTGLWTDRKRSAERSRGVFELIAYLNDGRDVNRTMAQRVSNRKAFDVGQCPELVTDREPLAIGAFDLTKHFDLDSFETLEIDFCNLRSGRWIQSIGVVVDGRILAAFDLRFATIAPPGRCLWAR